MPVAKRRTVVRKPPARSKTDLPHISASSRSAFKRCRYQWSYPYMRKLEPKLSSYPLRLGTLLHHALQFYYPVGIKRGPHPAKTFTKAFDKELVIAEQSGFINNAEWEEQKWLGIDMLEHYVDHYGADELWEVLATERRFTAPIANNDGEVIGEYVGVLDNILRNRSDKTIWIRDHKSTSSIQTGYLSMDDQSAGYWGFGPHYLREAGILGPKQDLQGIEFNFLRKGWKDIRPHNEQGQYLNKDGTVSKSQPPAHFLRKLSHRGPHERELTRQRCVAELLEMGMVMRGELGLLKTPDKQHCGWCGVKDICELHESGADWESALSMLMMPRRQFVEMSIDYEYAH